MDISRSPTWQESDLKTPIDTDAPRGPNPYLVLEPLQHLHRRGCLEALAQRIR